MTILTNPFLIAEFIAAFVALIAGSFLRKGGALFLFAGLAAFSAGVTHGLLAGAAMREVLIAALITLLPLLYGLRRKGGAK